MTKEEYKQVCRWIADGVCQTKDSNECKVFHDFDPEIESPEIWHNFSLYRQKPEPKLRPWKPEEVPVGAVIRIKKATVRHLIKAFDDFADKGSAGESFVFSTKFAFENCEHSTDRCATWQPCGVIE